MSDYQRYGFMASDQPLWSELREAADRFKENQEFQARVSAWVLPHLRRPALLKRLQDREFVLPRA